MSNNIILAIDGSGETAIAAIGGPNRATFFAYGGPGGAVVNVYSSIDGVLESALCDSSQIDTIVVNTGPGSWSRTRMAVVYCCGLAIATSAEVKGLTGFEIARRAYSVPQETPLALVDQIGNLILEEKNVSSADSDRRCFQVNLFPNLSKQEYLEERKKWLSEMIAYGTNVSSARDRSDPNSLRSTYFQEFPVHSRKKT